VELMKLEKLEMNECEKMANELIKKKEKIDCNLEDFFLKISIISIHLSPLIPLLNDKLNAILENYLLIAIFALVFTLSVSFIGVGIIALFYKLKKKKELSKDEEYQLAKEIMEKYNKKVLEIEEKEAIERKNIQYKATLEREKEKTERLIKMKEYLKGSES
jgi:hypothetical protein